MRNLALAAAIVLFMGAPLLAQPAKVTVTQVKASGSGGEVSIDPRLGELGKSLAKKFRYSQYTLVSSKATSIAVGGTATWKLADGKFLDIKLSGVRGEGKALKYSLALQIYTKSDDKREVILNMSATLSKGATFSYGLGGSRAVGGALILVIKAD
jgi:hypothetical protein